MAVPNPLRVELGQRLRTYRERADVSLRRIDEDAQLGWYPGKMSKVETGTRVPATAELHRIADLCRVDQDERANLVALAAGARKRTRMPHVADWAQSYVLLEQAATAIDYHDAELIPAILQTEGYARALLGLGDADHLDERVAERLSRGELLDRPNPPRVRVVLGEAALHRLPPEVHEAHGQLENLIRPRPTAEVRILPFERGLYQMIGVGFTTLHLSALATSRVYLEGATTATYLHEPSEVAVYEAKFEKLWTLAASADESATIVRRLIQRLE
ncbi:helix-turn-helix transcriptional regulator [Saccharothrix violaceirubra]|uniref:DUF5753 domain-containing protein n=1 Tax=Saccharothrix violaceirubra TaxID=413306 RepID=A0A7W7WVM3_9PSEU|nr:helix-turn-helix transcriptional regulator [Saccharothrix violaceirubra]MBB4964683.1 hypothetical protein [Saccharothrix violaceirubra]